MDITAAVRQAIAAGSISQSTINALGEWVSTTADTRALAILADAVSSNLVSVVDL